MKHEDDNVPEPLKEMIARNSDGRIRIDNQTPPRLGWRSARVTIFVPGSSELVSFTVHWRESSTCYIGLRGSAGLLRPQPSLGGDKVA